MEIIYSDWLPAARSDGQQRDAIAKDNKGLPKWIGRCNRPIEAGLHLCVHSAVICVSVRWSVVSVVGARELTIANVIGQTQNKKSKTTKTEKKKKKRTESPIHMIDEGIVCTLHYITTIEWAIGERFQPTINLINLLSGYGPFFLQFFFVARSPQPELWLFMMSSQIE